MRRKGKGSKTVYQERSEAREAPDEVGGGCDGVGHREGVTRLLEDVAES
jgi:hypothetical protein